MGQTCEDAFALYRRCISSGVVEYLQKQEQIKIRQSIYTAQVVIWLRVHVSKMGPERLLSFWPLILRRYIP